MTLAELLKSTPAGPWKVVPSVSRAGMFGGADAFVRAADDKTVATGVRTDRVAELIALAPDLARLALDMGEYIRRIGDHLSAYEDDYMRDEEKAILARLERIADSRNGLTSGESLDGIAGKENGE